MNVAGKIGAGRRPGGRAIWLIAAGAALVGAACGSTSTPSSSSGTGSLGSKTIPSVSVTTFSSDIASTMSQFKALTEYATQNSNSLQVGVILPDTTSSTRYVDFDAPYLTDAFADAGYTESQFRIDNAQGSDSTELDDATADINLGAKVLVMDPLDGPTGVAIAQLAESKGVTMISYDRATFQGSNTYYVSFDNEKVGELIGTNFLSCLTSENVSNPQVFVLNGGEDTDPNAISFAERLQQGGLGPGGQDGHRWCEEHLWRRDPGRRELRARVEQHPGRRRSSSRSSPPTRRSTPRSRPTTGWPAP